jgi:hypothetical protein
MMGPVAYLVIGEPHYRAVFLEHEPAIKAAVEHHGLVRNLVLEDQVATLCSAAYQQGIDTADRRMS